MLFKLFPLVCALSPLDRLHRLAYLAVRNLSFETSEGCLGQALIKTPEYNICHLLRHHEKGLNGNRFKRTAY
jgi:hypothetical protein